MSKFTLIHGPNISSSCTVLFTAPDVTFTPRCVTPKASFPLCPSLFILSEAIFLLFHSSILDMLWPGELIFWCHIFSTFCTVPGILKARILKQFTIPFSSGVWELSTMTHPSWTALHNMAYSFFELHKPLHHKTVIYGGAIYSYLEPIFFHIE